ncbi:MAG: aminotransferase class V-fold PLP-dependent enzyme [Spirochaetia bacterium]|nr:aminotransferase class V-fold PLP-dependent enzyme [Spirochaetia bacterium]
MSEKIFYMDNNATTSVDPAVRKAVLESFDLYGNASSMHGPGRHASAAIEKARGQVAALLGADADEIIFTSGGSESNNTVLDLVFSDLFSGSGRKRIITSSIEHPSVVETVESYREKGFPVTIIGVDSTGKLNMDELRKEAREDVALISIMTANNEIGTIQDIAEITRVAASCGALMHTDAVQAAGRIPLDLHGLGVDFASISGHKFHAPKGIGALFVRKGLHIAPLIRGGHQEGGQRAGTYNTPGIVGIGAAAEIALRLMEEDGKRIAMLRDRLRRGIEASIPDIHINGHPVDILPGTLNVSFPGAEGESILLYLDMEGVAVSTGSACATGSLEPSYVLIATGVGAELAHGSIRFSLGRYSTDEDVDFVLSKLPSIILRLREMSTL